MVSRDRTHHQFLFTVPTLLLLDSSPRSWTLGHLHPTTVSLFYSAVIGISIIRPQVDRCLNHLIPICIKDIYNGDGGDGG
jgi:hypothetical protein